MASAAVTQYNSTVGSDTVWKFNGTGYMQVTIPSDATTIWVTIIAGGASGGASDGGGGGAGGVINQTSTEIVPGGAYNITVGAGGAVQAGSPWYGKNGSVSAVSNLTWGLNATGGGGGAGAGTVAGFPGGSGGGGTTARPGLAGIAGQGMAGGNGNPSALGGGGGGNSSVGVAATSTVGGDGGTGFTATIDGGTTMYACGGGGGTPSASKAGRGGCTGAGNGGNATGATSAAAETGSGGGGGVASGASGAGGSGVVIIRFISSQLAAAFTSTPNPSLVDQTVQFNDTSAGSPTTWNWTFGDGNTSTLQNPTNAFPEAGTYSVNLNVTNSTGDFSDISHDQVVSDAVSPLAMFTKSHWILIFPRSVQFNDTSTNTPTAWNWSFGDGKYSEVQDPSHQYVKRGRWTVLLNASNTAGFSTNTSTVWIIGG